MKRMRPFPSGSHASDTPEEAALITCLHLPARAMVSGCRVLDLACHSRHGAGMLLEWGASEVVCVDPDEALIEAARQIETNEPAIRFVAADIATFVEAHGRDFDVILFTGSFGRLPDPEALMNALAVLRKAGASVILSCPNDPFLYGRGLAVSDDRATPLSFYDFRSLTERHLGEGEWCLGVPGSGFSAIAVDAAGDTAPAMAIVPGPMAERDRLKPSTALFYLGTWSSVPVAKGYQASFACSSHYRMPGLVHPSDEVAEGHARRIAFVIDQHGWAFDNIVRNIRPFLEGRYEISVFCIADYHDKASLLQALFVEEDFQNVHVMWREFLFDCLSDKRTMGDLLGLSGLTARDLADRMAAPVLTTSVYDHLFLRPEDIAARQEHFILVDAYATSSSLLQDAYRSACDKMPAVEIPDGVNVERFAPARGAQQARREEPAPVFRIGWVGNSGWGRNNASMVEDPKGLQTILRPAVEQLALEGYPVAFELADRSIRHRDPDDMVTYYGKIDVLVCASAAEGTPNPILEAMASGVPFVSTDVGIVREVAGPLQENFILSERTVPCMYDALKRILDTPEHRTALAEENVERIRDWRWQTRAVKWLHLFREAENHHATLGRALRRAILSTRLSGCK